jgi:hypothetical protein
VQEAPQERGIWAERYVRDFLALPFISEFMFREGVHMVNVDVIGAQPLQAALACLDQVIAGRPGVIRTFAEGEGRLGRDPAHMSIRHRNAQVLSSRYGHFGSNRPTGTVDLRFLTSTTTRLCRIQVTWLSFRPQEPQKTGHSGHPRIRALLVPGQHDHIGDPCFATTPSFHLSH